MQEKEDKKQKALEEKEQKQKEREEKIREQEAKKKAEEKEEKARKAALKKAKNAKQSKSLKTNISIRKRKAFQLSSVISSKRSNAATDVLESRDESSTVKENPPDTLAVSSTGLTVSGGFDPNMCCMCFSNFEDDMLDGCGADWLEYPCG